MRRKLGCLPGLSAESAIVTDTVELLNEEMGVRIIVTEVLVIKVSVRGRSEKCCDYNNCLGFNRQAKTH